MLWGRALGDLPWLRTNGVNTNGVAAKKVVVVSQIGEEYMPWHFGEMRSKNLNVSVTPLVLTPLYIIQHNII